MRPAATLKAILLSAAMTCIGAAALSASADDASVAAAPTDELDPDATVSQLAVELAAWVIAAHDNEGYPFAVLDKDASQLLVFDGEGKIRGIGPVLIGSAVGDESAPGVGDRELADIPMEDRTTPAGRFIAAYGRAAGDQRVLWVDYPTAISIHPLPARETAEKRSARLASPTAEDNRITHGCINVSPAFYGDVVSPLFAKGGLFYVLPDRWSLAETFPDFTPVGAASALEANETVAGARPTGGES